MAYVLFRFNTRQLGEKIRAELQAIPSKTRRAMNAVGGFLNGEVRDLVPVDAGDLTASIHNETVEYQKSFAAVIYVPSNAPAAAYAIPMHENQYQLGKNSIAKQRKVGKSVGRKYITRALEDNLDDIRSIIKSEVRV